MQKMFNDTPPGAPLKEKIRLEKEKLQEMTFKKKVEHIWNYYKFLLLAIVALIIIIVAIINAIANPRPQTALFIAWSGGFVLDEQLTELTDTLTEQILDTKKNEIVEATFFFSSQDDPMMEMANVQRLVAMLAAGSIDIFVLNHEQLVEYSENSFIQPLDITLEKVRAENPAVYNKIEDYLIYVSYSDEEDVITERIMGIEITDSPLLADLEFFKQELYFSISSTARNEDNIVLALIEFFR